MLLKSIATVLAVAGLAAAQTNTTAPLTKGVAHIKSKGIDAQFTFEKVAEGVKVTVEVASGLTKALQILETGFQYHIHEKPVTADNCTLTGGHLNPTGVNYTAGPACDPKNVTTCEVGDLSGKNGNLIAVNNDTGAIPVFSFVDTQLNFTGVGAITGRSVVIHNNVTRIACADLIVEGFTNPTNGTGNTTATSGGPKPTDKPSSAVKLVGSVALSGLVAAMMLAL